MATGIEFTSRPGKAFVAALKNPQDAYSTVESGINCAEVSAGRYRFATSRSGVVWVDAVDGATRMVGFADLDRPSPNGYSDVIDAIDANAAAILAILSSGEITHSAPVTPTGTITTIVIGDDYKAASNRSFAWFFDVPAFSAVGSRCFFGGSAKHKGQWLVEGTIVPVTVESVPKWKLQFELLDADTAACKPGCYDWSVELRGPAPEQITKIIGTTELVQAYTR